MSKARHRRIDWASRELRIRVAAVTLSAALVAGTLAVYGVTRGSGPSVGATDASASSTVSVPPASPAEGHSPRLTRELSGSLSKTGVHRSRSGVAMSTTTQRASTTAATGLLNGIDVASFQHPALSGGGNAPIDWTQVAGAGYQFAAIKATEYTHTASGAFYVNPFYTSDAKAAVAAGLYVAAYHFANPFNGNGTVQAQFAAQNAGTAQNSTGADYKVGGHYLPMMLDLEFNPYIPDDGGNECYGLTPSAMVSWVSSFITEAETLTGAAPIIYTPPAWWATCTGSSTAFGSNVLWVPAFSVNTPGTLPAGWNTWNFWQYSSTSNSTNIVPGISTSASVDLDYFSGGPQSEQTTVNKPASVQIRTLNALAGQAVTYSASGLPPGMTISSAGLITGTPTATGTYQVTVTGSSSAAVLPGSVSFTWEVDQPPAITSAAHVTFQAGAAGTFTAAATGFPTPAFSETGALPAGVTFSSAGVLSGTPPAGAIGIYPITVSATNSAGTATQALTLTVDGDTSYTAAGPVRVLDTRNAIGHSGAVGPNGTISLQVTGANGVPATGVTAVVLNVTITGPTAASYVTVYPDGTTRPNASSLNFTAGQTIPNLVTVPVAADGKIDFYNHSGSVSVIADLAGYYTSGTGSSFVPAGPSRMLDTRNAIGHSGAVGPNSAISLQVAGANGVPATGVTAVVLNVTITGPTAASYITVYPDGKARPNASNLNFTARETTSNLVVVPVGADGKVDFYNRSGSVSVIADLAGYYSSAAGGSGFHSPGPVRVLDTRNAIGHSGAVGRGGTISLQVTGANGVPATGVTAVVLNVTITGPTASSYVTVFPDGISRPNASNLNFAAGATISNLVVVPVGADGMVDFYNNSGSVNLIADLAGYFTSS